VRLASSIAAGLTALSFVAAVAASQEVPTGRVIADMTVWTIPGGGDGPCIVLDAGQLTVNVQLVGDEPSQPVEFFFAGYRGSDPAALVQASVSRAPQTATVPLAGGLYCYSLRNQAPVLDSAGLSVLTNYAQDVALKLTIGPVAATADVAPAGPAMPVTAAAPPSAPPPEPAPSPAARAATYEGLTLTVLSTERGWRHPSGSSILDPKPNMECLALELRVDNGTDRPRDFNPAGIQLQAVDSTRWRDFNFLRLPSLQMGQVLPLESMRGWVVFQIPVGVPIVRMIWQP
jgi:hypothetical protein